MRLAVTGHMNLTEESITLVASAIREILADLPAEGLVGISCIARGADSVFADEVIKAGGKLEVVLPSRDYRETKVSPDHLPLFDRLLAEADQVHTLPFRTANRDAYVGANNTMLALADQLVAVWDGVPSPDRGGTAGVVADARDRGLPVTVVWPAGCGRDFSPRTRKETGRNRGKDQAARARL